MLTLSSIIEVIKFILSIPLLAIGIVIIIIAGYILYNFLIVVPSILANIGTTIMYILLGVYRIISFFVMLVGVFLIGDTLVKCISPNSHLMYSISRSIFFENISEIVYEFYEIEVIKKFVDNFRDIFMAESMSNISKLIILLIIFDLFWSMTSIISSIPIGKNYYKTRIPIIAAIIVKIVQLIYKKPKYYCSTCNMKVSFNDRQVKCLCGSINKLKRMGIMGGLYYRCTNPKCTYSSRYLISPLCSEFTECDEIYGPWDINLVTKKISGAKFSRLLPFSKKNLNKFDVRCENCGTELDVTEGNAVSFCLYAEKEEMASKFREVFFYNTFLRKSNEREELKRIEFTWKIHRMLKEIFENIKIVFSNKATYIIRPTNKDYLIDIAKHYISGNARVTLDKIVFSLKTSYPSINKRRFIFRVVLKNSSDNYFTMPDGIIILLDATETPMNRMSIVDTILLNITQIGYADKKYMKPILIGLCADNENDLSSKIENGFDNAAQIEKYCKEFLIKNNNSDIINKLYEIAENVHFFIYRTGTIAGEDEEDIFNVEQPVHSLITSEVKDTGYIFKADTQGFYFSVRGK